MEDMLAGLNEWRNIQDVVRQTFKELHGVVLVQGDKIKALERETVRVKDLQSIEVSLANKPTFIEMQKAVENASEKCESKVSEIEIELKTKAEKEELKDLYSGLTLITTTRKNTSDIEALVQQQQKEIENLKRRINMYEEKQQVDSVSLASRSWTSELVSEEFGALKRECEKIRNEQHVQNEKLHSDMLTLPTHEDLKAKLDIDTYVKNLKELSTKEEMRDAVSNNCDRIRAQIVSSQQKLFTETVKTFEQKADKTDVQQILKGKIGREELDQMLATKVDMDVMESKVSETNDRIVSEFQDVMDEMQKEIVSVLNKKAFKSEIYSTLESKVDLKDVKTWLAHKVDVTDIRDALQQKADSSSVEELVKTMQVGHKDCLSKIEQKISEIVLQNDEGIYEYISDNEKKMRNTVNNNETKKATKNTSTLRKKIRELEFSLEEKSSEMKDLCILLDGKASIEDVNKALTEMSTQFQLPLKSSKLIGVDDLHNSEIVKKIRKDLDAVCEAINVELSLGRWIWKSGRVRQDRTIPWNIECINTATDNLQWTKDTPEIVAISPGLYEVSMGFFSDKDPNIQVLVNGEPAFIFHGSTNVSQSVHHNHTRQHYNYGGETQSVNALRPSRKQGVLRRCKHSAGNVTGWTLCEYVALPSRARIAVLYDGPSDVQGFLTLRKL
uniref:Uncharacterized protein n=1 Tax=Aplanochytrium stocchinoi TaxID=215587 RepID=A0A7S3LKV9_9STRA